MKKFKDSLFTLRIITGGIILIHGLLRIMFINKYVDFVLFNFSDLLKSETILLVGASLLPFLEFFTGLLIIFNVAIKKCIKAGFIISILMALFIVAGNLYPRLIYHSVVLILLFLITEVNRVQTNKNRALSD